MSSQKGNVKKSGPRKHQNQTAFKNSLHDTSKRTQAINSIDVSGVCARCRDVVEWKIKYKKYKPLTQPKTCVKCLQRTVKRAYYIVCNACVQTHSICAKCSKSKEIVQKPALSEQEEAHEQSQREFELRQLPERKRRRFYRYQAQGKLQETSGSNNDNRDDEDSEASDNDSEYSDNTEDVSEEALKKCVADMNISEKSAECDKLQPDTS